MLAVGGCGGAFVPWWGFALVFAVVYVLARKLENAHADLAEERWRQTPDGRACQERLDRAWFDLELAEEDHRRHLQRQAAERWVEEPKPEALPPVTVREVARGLLLLAALPAALWAGAVAAEATNSGAGFFWAFVGSLAALLGAGWLMKPRQVEVKP